MLGTRVCVLGDTGLGGSTISTLPQCVNILQTMFLTQFYFGTHYLTYTCLNWADKTNCCCHEGVLIELHMKKCYYHKQALHYGLNLTVLN